MKQSAVQKLSNKKANIWLTTLVVLGVVGGFILIQGIVMLSSQSTVSALNISQAGPLTDSYVARTQSNKQGVGIQTLADLLSPSPKPHSVKTQFPSSKTTTTTIPFGGQAKDTGQPSSSDQTAPAPPATVTVMYPNPPVSPDRWYNNKPRQGYGVQWYGVSTKAKTGTVAINLVAYTSACTTQSCPTSNTRYPITGSAPNNGIFIIQPTQLPAADLREGVVPDRVPAGQYVVEVIGNAESDVSDGPFAVADNPIPDIFSPFCQQFKLKVGQRAWITYQQLNLNIERGADSASQAQISSQQGGWIGNTNYRLSFAVSEGQALSVHYAALKFIGRDGDSAIFEVRPGGTTQVSGGQITQEYIPDFNGPCSFSYGPR